MSFLGGGGGQNQTSNSFSYYTPHFYTPYQNFSDQSLTNATNLRDAAFQPYDISKMFAPFTQDQNNAFQGTRDLQSQWQPFFNSGQQALQQYGGIGQSAFNAAAQQPTALQASKPYADAAAKTWNDPATQASYLNPYINNTVQAGNQLQTSNFLNNTLPGLSSQFVASGGGLGGKAYGNAFNTALTNFNQNLGNTDQGALANAYQGAAGIFGQDQSRLAGLAGTIGNQATQGTQALTGLGQAATGAGTSMANAYGNLGQGYLGAGLTANNALLQAGNQQQQFNQQPLTAAYNQFEQGIQWPYQTNSWAANTINQYQWPNASSTNSNTNTTGSSGSSNSLFGSLLGGAATLGSLAIPGAGGMSAFGNLFGGLGGLFGGGGSGSGTQYRRGGYFTGAPVRKARGGFLGIDAPSFPPVITNPGYFKLMPEAAFKRGGMARPRRAAFAEGGDVLHGILGAAGSLLGNLIPIPVVGPTLGKFAGHALGDIFGGNTGNLDDDLVQDFAAPLPFGSKISNAVLRGDPSKGAAQGPGDAIERGVGMFNPGSLLGGDLGGGSGFTFAAGGTVPVIRAARAATRRNVGAARARQARPAFGGTTKSLSANNSGFFNV